MSSGGAVAPGSPPSPWSPPERNTVGNPAGTYIDWVGMYVVYSDTRTAKKVSSSVRVHVTFWYLIINIRDLLYVVADTPRWVYQNRSVFHGVSTVFSRASPTPPPFFFFFLFLSTTMTIHTLCIQLLFDLTMLLFFLLFSFQRPCLSENARLLRFTVLSVNVK